MKRWIRSWRPSWPRNSSSEWGKDDAIAYAVALVLLAGGFGVMFHALQFKTAPSYATFQAEGVRR